MMVKCFSLKQIMQVSSSCSLCQVDVQPSEKEGMRFSLNKDSFSFLKRKGKKKKKTSAIRSVSFFNIDKILLRSLPAHRAPSLAQQRTHNKPACE